MKQFIILLLKVAAIFIAVNIITVMFLDYTGVSRFLPYIKPFLSVKNHYQIAVVGDSHADNVWQKSTDPEVLNLSAGSDNQIDIARKIAFMLNNQIKVDNLLYEIDHSQFTNYRNKYHNNDLSICLERNVPMWIAYYLPFVFNPAIKQELKAALKAVRFKKSNKGQNISSSCSSEMKDRADIQFLKTTYSDSLFNQMKRNLHIIKPVNPNVSLIYYPLSKNYLSLIDTSTVYKRIGNFTDQYVRASQFPVLNYTNALCRDDNFSNQDHVKPDSSDFLRSHILNTSLRKQPAVVNCLDVL